MFDSKMSLCMSALTSKIQRQTAALQTNINMTPYLNDNSQAGIYICTYLHDKRYVYIGKTIDFSRRWEEHVSDLIKGSHCGYFQTFYKEHGCSPADFKWEILEALDLNHIIISEREKFWIRKYDNDGYHILLNSQKYKEK